MKVAREGLPFLGGGAALTLLFWVGAGLFPVLVYASGICGFASLLVLFFFRDPDRSTPSEPGVVVAAADGKVVCIEDAGTNDYLGGGAVQVSIFLSVFDVHVNRIPISGVVDFVKWRPGSFLLAYKAEASAENEQSIIGIRSDTTRIVVKQIAGILARRIVCRLQGRETVRAGDRFGLIRFGSRVDLILPSGADLRVAVGDRVRAGETIIGAIHNV